MADILLANVLGKDIYSVGSPPGFDILPSGSAQQELANYNNWDSYGQQYVRSQPGSYLGKCIALQVNKNGNTYMYIDGTKAGTEYGQAGYEYFEFLKGQYVDGDGNNIVMVSDSGKVVALPGGGPGGTDPNGIPNGNGLGNDKKNNNLLIIAIIAALVIVSRN